MEDDTRFNITASFLAGVGVPAIAAAHVFCDEARKINGSAFKITDEAVKNAASRIDPKTLIVAGLCAVPAVFAGLSINDALSDEERSR